MTKDSSAKRKAGKRKPEKLSFTQDFIPIKNLEHGIIETTDGRYIKILEIEPINFMLRSEEEQYEIICSFASWLKISPVHLQFKSITRKADSDKHIAMLRKEMETEESEQCKKLSEGYIRLIKDVGSREALTRRFFLIFRYEELRRNENSDYGQICSTLLTTEQNARAYFMQCGNNILQPKDPDEATAEILYMFFNRRSCVEEPFHSRVDRIVLDTMAAKNKVIGIDPIPHIRMAHFIAPRGIDLMHRNYIIMDGLYYSFLYIKGNGYPNKVRAGWMSSLINAGEGIDVDVFLRRENRSKTIDKVAQRIRLNRTKLKSMQDTSTDYEELAGSIQAGYFIKQGIANYNEDLFYMSVFVTVSARTYEELMWRKQQMTDMLKSMDMYVSDCSFQQEDALRTVMPFLQISPKLEKKSKRNVLTSGAASTYMFTSFEMSDDTGVLLGINRHNNSLCMLHCDLSQQEQHRRKEIAEHTRQMLLTELPIDSQDETSIMGKYRDYYLQISFSELHPLMVVCLAKALTHPGTAKQCRIANDLNLRSVLGSHAINDEVGCYSYRATHWLDTELDAKRFYEILDRCVDEADRGFYKLAC